MQKSVAKPPRQYKLWVCETCSPYALSTQGCKAEPLSLKHCMSEVSQGPRTVLSSRILTKKAYFYNTAYVRQHFLQVLRVQDLGSIAAKNESLQGTFKLASSPLTLCYHMFVKHANTELKKIPSARFLRG